MLTTRFTPRIRRASSSAAAFASLDGTMPNRVRSPSTVSTLMSSAGVRRSASRRSFVADVADVLHALDRPDCLLRFGLVVRRADPAMQGDTAVYGVDVDVHHAQALGCEQGHLGPGRNPRIACARQGCP